MSDGEHAELGRRPKLMDVADRAGVSIATVSNALNHPDKVAPPTLERVTAAIRELGFSRNNMARALASGDTRTIGLVVVTLSNSLFVDIARGAQRIARSRNYSLQVASAEDEFEEQEAQIDLFDGGRVSGLLLAPMEESHAAIERLRRHGRPVVVLNYRSAVDDVCTVLIDNERVGYLAARHLIDLGRRRIAFVAGRYHLQPVAERRAGVHRAIAETDGRVELIDIEVAGLNAPDGRWAGDQLLELGDRRPDGVIAVTDLLGMAVILRMVSSGVRVPEEVAVIGCDSNSSAWGGAIPLSSMSMRGEDIGERAVELLLAEIAEGSAGHRHRTVVLEPELVIRESTVGRPPEDLQP